MNYENEYKTMKTTNYSMFKVLVGNRDVTERRKKRIIASIQESGYLPIPIIVNEKDEVIDGGGRLEACKELGLPVYYMRVKGIGLYECIVLNKYSTAWEIPDYIHSHMEQGDRNYAILSQFIAKYPTVSLDGILCALSGRNCSDKKIKDGKFQIDPECMKDADELLKYLVDTVKESGVKGRKVNLELALVWCYRNDSIDNERLKRGLKSRSHTLKAYSNISEWIEAIENVYNYGLSQKKKVAIYPLWKIEKLKG